MHNLLKPFVVKLVSAERPEFPLVIYVGCKTCCGHQWLGAEIRAGGADSGAVGADNQASGPDRKACGADSKDI